MSPRCRKAGPWTQGMDRAAYVTECPRQDVRAASAGFQLASESPGYRQQFASTIPESCSFNSQASEWTSATRHAHPNGHDKFRIPWRSEFSVLSYNGPQWIYPQNALQPNAKRREEQESPLQYRTRPYPEHKSRVQDRRQTLLLSGRVQELSQCNTNRPAIRPHVSPTATPCHGETLADSDCLCLRNILLPLSCSEYTQQFRAPTTRRILLPLC